MSCLVPGCTNPAPYFLGIRLRRPKMRPRRKSHGTAIWSPECKAYLCAVHAAQGYTIDITLTPTANNSITTNVSVPGGQVVSRTTPITNTIT
jgi:hypothetical protein